MRHDSDDNHPAKSRSVKTGVYWVILMCVGEATGLTADAGSVVMTWIIHFDEVKRLVFVKVTGPIKRSPLREMTKELRDTVLQNGSRGILLDYTQTTSKLEPYEIFERPKVLTEIGFPLEVKVAVLYSALDENTRFLENVYRNKKFPVHVFDQQKEALAWLEQTSV